MKKLIFILVIVLMGGNRLIKNETVNLIVSIIAALTILGLVTKLIMDKKIIFTRQKLLTLSFFILLSLGLYFYYSIKVS